MFPFKKNIKHKLELKYLNFSLRMIESSKFQKISDTCSKDNFDFIFARLIELLNLSIKNK